MEMTKHLLKTNGTNAFSLFKQREREKIEQMMTQKSAFCKQFPLCYSTTQFCSTVISSNKRVCIFCVVLSSRALLKMVLSLTGVP